MIARKDTNLPLRYFWYALVSLMAFIMLVPYLWMVIAAFKPVPEMNEIPPTLYVRHPTLNNFYDPLGNTPPDHQEGLLQQWPNVAGSFFRFYFNSVFVSAVVTSGSLLLASMAAYALAKHRFPGRNFLFIMFVASMMLPWQVTIISNFLQIRDFGWYDTYWALIIPALPNAFALFFMRQYMLSLPDELLDAARVDGASEVRIWATVVLPLIGPALVAMSIFVFLNQWSNLVWPLIVLKPGSDIRTLPVILSTLIDPQSGLLRQGIAMAAALLVSLPTLGLFIVFQRQFVEGIALTGVKG